MGRAPRQTATRGSGTVVDWFDDRGYGFIEAGDGRRLFFHISAVRERVARAHVGDRVTFAIGEGRDGKPAAVDVAIAGAGQRSREAEQRGSPRLSARDSYRVYGALLLSAVLVGAVAIDRAPLWLAAIYVVVGAISFVLYAVDKRSAVTETWRTPEATLHAVDLAGGIIGGLLAQQMLRHKTAKPSFMLVTAAIAAMHLFGLLAIAAGSLSPAEIEAVLRQFT